MTSQISPPPKIVLIEEDIKVCKGCHVKSILIEGWGGPFSNEEECPFIREDFDIDKYPFTKDVVRYYLGKHRWGLDYKASLMVQHQSNSVNCYNYKLEKVFQIFQEINLN